MCGRYVLYDTDDLSERFNVPVGGPIFPTYNAAPTNIMPVITQKGLEVMRWGLVPKWAKDTKVSYKLFNARSETAFQKPMWRALITEQRCLVPANGFYEWKKQDDGKQPYYIHMKNEPLFAFAGVWESWRTGTVEELHTYSILTTEPNKEMRLVHDRMPVILHKSDESQWLQADTRADIEPLLHPYQDGTLEMYAVSKEVNTTQTNNESLIGPLNSR